MAHALSLDGRGRCYRPDPGLSVRALGHLSRRQRPLAKLDMRVAIVLPSYIFTFCHDIFVMTNRS